MVGISLVPRDGSNPGQFEARKAGPKCGKRSTNT
jgi:hypothetical protein